MRRIIQNKHVNNTEKRMKKIKRIERTKITKKLRKNIFWKTIPMI